MQPVRVVLVDDHEIIRAGLAALLARESEIDLVASAATGEEALSLIELHQPDVVVADYRMPGISGVELCQRVMERWPSVAVILLTTYLDDDILLGAFRAGARAFVYKDVQAEELKRAIRKVAAGETVIDSNVASRLVDWAKPVRALGAHHAPLSEREIDVLRLVSRGAPNHVIAEELGVSDSTVKTYVRRALTKLQCDSRSQAVSVATRRGLL